MVNNSRNMSKQPLMRAISQKEYVLFGRTTEVAPPPRNDGTGTCSMNRFYESPRHSLRVIYNNASEADINRGWSCSEKGGKFRGRRILWWFAEEETTDILLLSANMK